ncbi:hypothetical protein ACE1SV_26570 [Streptomyces sp. E-15]
MSRYVSYVGRHVGAGGPECRKVVLDTPMSLAVGGSAARWCGAPSFRGVNPTVNRAVDHPPCRPPTAYGQITEDPPAVSSSAGTTPPGAGVRRNP